MLCLPNAEDRRRAQDNLDVDFWVCTSPALTDIEEESVKSMLQESCVQCQHAFCATCYLWNNKSHILKYSVTVDKVVLSVRVVGMGIETGDGHVVNSSHAYVQVIG